MISMARIRIAVFLPLFISFFLTGCALSGLEKEIRETQSDNSQPSDAQESSSNSDESSSDNSESNSSEYPTEVEKLTKKQLIEILTSYVPIENTKAINLDSFTEEFESNSVVAEEKYTNKPVKLLAKIDSIDNDATGSIYVDLEKPISGEYDLSLESVVCDGVSRQTAKSMKKGEIVTVYGYVGSTDLGVRFVWCYFGESKPQGIKPSEAVKLLSSEEK